MRDRQPVRLIAAVLLMASSAVLTGCGQDPVSAGAKVATQGLDAARKVEVRAALLNAATDVTAWTAENGSTPNSQTEFESIPGAQSAAVKLTYTTSSVGFCLVGTSVQPPVTTLVYRMRGGFVDGATTC